MPPSWDADADPNDSDHAAFAATRGATAVECAQLAATFAPSKDSRLFRDRVDGTHAEAAAPRRRQAVPEVLAPILTFVSFMTSR